MVCGGCGKKPAMSIERAVSPHNGIKLAAGSKIILNPRASSVIKKPLRPVNDVEKYRA